MADNYNPVQTVSPNVGSSDNLLNVQASPRDFGAGVGEGFQALGNAGEQAAKSQMQVEMQRQGMQNETYVADAEAKLNKEIGDTDGWYKSLKGQAAVGAYEEATKRISDARSRIAASMPNEAAKRSFNTLAARTEGFTLRDYGNYKGAQQKQSFLDAKSALQEQAIDSASKTGVANDPYQLGQALGTVADTAAGLVQAQGWDLNTKEGKDVYKQYLDTQQGRIWENAIKTVAFDPETGDVNKAVKMLEDNRDRIPAKMYAQLAHELQAPYRNNQTRGVADETIGWADKKYTDSITTVTPLPPPLGTKGSDDEKVWGGVPLANPGNQPDIHSVTDRFIHQESGGKGDNLGQIQPGTWQRYAKPNEDINDPIDNRRVTERILTDLSKKYNGDLKKVAVAYFSGEGNVSESGDTPWKNDLKDKNGKSVSSYVSDITGGQQQAQQIGQPVVKNAPTYINKADYYRENYGEIVKHARDAAWEKFHDVGLADAAASRVEQRISEVIRTQDLSDKVNADRVRRFVFGEDNGGHMITSIDQLENASPEMRDAWHKFETDNPLGAEAIKNRIITANSRGKSLEYGTDFWKHYEDMVSGKITNDTQLYGYVDPAKGKLSPLTNTGLQMLIKERQLAGTPEGAAFLNAEKAYFERLRTEIVGSLAGHNPRGEQIFQKAMMQLLPQIQAARANGLSAGDLFDKESGNYLGDASRWDTRPLDIRLKDFQTIISPLTVGGLVNPHLNDPEKLKTAVGGLDKVTDGKAGNTQLQGMVDKKLMSPEEARAYSEKRGWSRKRLPEVPARAY